MTKNDCVNYCLESIKDSWLKYPAPSDFYKRQSIYEECKCYCAMQGYEGGSFTDIWSRAIDCYIYVYRK